MNTAEFKIPTAFSVVDNVAKVGKGWRSRVRRFGIPRPWRPRSALSALAHWVGAQLYGAEDSPAQVTLWRRLCPNLKTGPCTRAKQTLGSLLLTCLPQTPEPTCSSPSPSHSHRCLHFGRGSGHMGLWSTVASCGPPRGLCSPPTSSVGWAAPGPGCWVALFLARPFLNLLLRAAAPGPGEWGLGGSALCL